MNNLPFTINDLLERLVPGTFFSIVLLFVMRDHLPNLTTDNNARYIITFGSIILFYVIGVIINIAASKITAWDYRYYLTETFLKKNKDAKTQKFVKIYETCFGLKPDAKCWQMCYGIANSKGYAVKTNLFSSLYILCGSMAVACFADIALITFFLLNDYILIKDYIAPFIVLVAMGCLFFVGEKSYSRAFTESIYDSFLTWYLIEKAPSDAE